MLSKYSNATLINELIFDDVCFSVLYVGSLTTLHKGIHVLMIDVAQMWKDINKMWGFTACFTVHDRILFNGQNDTRRTNLLLILDKINMQWCAKFS